MVSPELAHCLNIGVKSPYISETLASMKRNKHIIHTGEKDGTVRNINTDIQQDNILTII
jgi:hypothetical protein